MELRKGVPRQLGAGLGHRAPMHSFRLGPEAAAPGVPKEGTGFAIHTLLSTAGREGQQKNEQRGQRQFALAAKCRGRGNVVWRGKTAGN